MKKKLRDCSQEELRECCRKANTCSSCKLNVPNNGCFSCLKYVDKTYLSDKALNIEIDIPQPHILDKKEHDYLRAVCKPYDVYKIAKIDCISCYKITIFYNTPNDTYLTFSLPIFDEESPMYKGMEPDEHYTIEELELDKEWNNEN